MSYFGLKFLQYTQYIILLKYVKKIVFFFKPEYETVSLNYFYPNVTNETLRFLRKKSRFRIK